MVFETTTDENGEYEIQVPALAKSIEADIKPEDFVADQTIPDPDDYDKTTTRKRLYFGADNEVDFREKLTSYVRIFFSDTNFE